MNPGSEAVNRFPTPACSRAFYEPKYITREAGFSSYVLEFIVGEFRSRLAKNGSYGAKFGSDRTRKARLLGREREGVLLTQRFELRVTQNAQRGRELQVTIRSHRQPAEHKNNLTGSSRSGH